MKEKKEGAGFWEKIIEILMKIILILETGGES